MHDISRRKSQRIAKFDCLAMNSFVEEVIINYCYQFFGKLYENLKLKLWKSVTPKNY